MSNYTIYTSIGWDTRDGLTTGATGKTISGTDFHNEFTAIATAVSSKADIAGPALTGIPTAPTANADTNTEQVATTRYVQTELTNHLLSIYPVDSIYTSVSSTNPSSLFGGSWLAFGEGKVLVGKAGSGTFDTAGATGGSETHALIEAELPSHTHTVSHTTVADKLYGGTDANRTRTDITGSASNETTSSTGSGTAHNNLQPYVVVYMWKRTA